MPRKNYDDDLLVELIARDDQSLDAISRRVGLSTAHICRIAKGSSRKDLWPRIEAARARRRDQAPDRQQRTAEYVDELPPAPACKRSKHYDDYLLVELIARSDLSHREIARRVGIHHRTVWAVANGQTRPDLQPLIRQARSGIWQALNGRVISTLEMLAKQHIAVGMSEHNELGRKCREYIMDLVWDWLPDDEPEVQPQAQPQIDAQLENVLRKLSPTTRGRVLAEFGLDESPESF